GVEVRFVEFSIGHGAAHGWITPKDRGGWSDTSRRAADRRGYKGTGSEASRPQRFRRAPSAPGRLSAVPARKALADSSRHPATRREKSTPPPPRAHPRYFPSSPCAGRPPVTIPASGSVR